MTVGKDGELPHDVESEVQVLGSIFKDETYIHRVALMLESSDPYCNRLYALCPEGKRYSLPA